MWLGWRTPRVNNLKLAKPHKNWECARKLLYFYYVAVICRTTGGTEEIWACVSRYNQSAWTANKGRRNRGAWRGTALWKGSNGTQVPLLLTSNFMVYQDNLKQIYCSYSRTQNLEWFSIIYVIIFKVSIVAEHVNAKRMAIIVLFYTELKQIIFNSWYSASEIWAAAGEERAFAPLGNWD